MNKSHLSTKQLRKIRKNLPHGSISKIADKLNLDISTVSKVLTGRFNNNEVIEHAISIVKENRVKINSLSDEVNKL